MDENKDFVTEQVTDNAEQTAEQTPKTYTEAEFHAKLDEVLGKKLARREAKIRKEYERQYGDLLNVLEAGTGKKNVGEITDTFGKYYESKGIKIEKKPEYSGRDLEILAKADADDIIRLGYDEVVDEIERLSGLGVANMTAREKATFKVLAEHRQEAERNKELEKIGVPKDVYNSAEFKDFQKMFTNETPMSKIYETYAKTQPKKEIQTMGSMKNNTVDDRAVKDFYSYEEAVRFTKKDFDKNPELMKAVEASMRQW